MCTKHGQYVWRSVHGDAVYPYLGQTKAKCTAGDGVERVATGPDSRLVGDDLELAVGAAPLEAPRDAGDVGGHLERALGVEDARLLVAVVAVHPRAVAAEDQSLAGRGRRGLGGCHGHEVLRLQQLELSIVGKVGEQNDTDQSLHATVRSAAGRQVFILFCTLSHFAPASQLGVRGEGGKTRQCNPTQSQHGLPARATNGMASFARRADAAKK